MSYRNMWGYNKLSSSERTYLHGFGSFIEKELCYTAQGIYKVLSKGYSQMVEADKKAYLSSPEYIQAKAEQDATRKDCSGINKGIEDFHNQLGYWIPAKRVNGQKNHITFSKPDCENELSYVPISKDNYVAERALKLSRRYSDLTSLVGILFSMLSSDSPRHPNSALRNIIEDFACKHYKDSNFSIESHLAPLREVFPKAIEKGVVCLNHIPEVIDRSWITVHLMSNNCYTTIRVGVGDHPNHNQLIGLHIGDSFSLASKDRLLSFEEETFGSLFNEPKITSDILTYKIIFIY